MAKTDLIIPSLGNKFVDYREYIPGDSYNWSWIRPLSQVNYLAIHQSSTTDTQTPEDIANFHINNNGWGGIGYHFLISKDGKVFYVGDISTARANVANINEQILGICLIGNFIEDRSPTIEQLDSTHKLCDYFINNYSELSNVNSWDKVRGHKELPGQSTNCPGDNWEDWRIQIVEGVIELEAPSNEATFDDVEMLESQVNNLQASLGSVNQQLISFQEKLLERDQEINKLKSIQVVKVSGDQTLTITQVLINLSQFLLRPRKVDSEFIGM